MEYIHTWESWPPHVQQAARQAAAEGRSIGPILCPGCDGRSKYGDAREDSLSVWVDGAFYVAHCWRASCSYHGRVPLRPGTKIGRPRFDPKFYRGSLQEIHGDSPLYKHLMHSYGLSLRTLQASGCKDATSGCTLALYVPVYGPDSRSERGSIVRRFEAFIGPKVLTYKASEAPLQAWYPREGENIIIVEDVLSAMRVWQAGKSAVALLGTELSPAKANEIYVHTGPSRTATLCLDADATSKAIAYARKYPWLRVKRLERDLKDCDMLTLEEVLNG